MISEIATAAKVVEAKIAEKGAEEIGKNVARNGVDISKRLDVSKKVLETQKSGVDITKRIQPENGDSFKKEISRSDLKDAVRDYLTDLKSKSTFSDTLKDKNLDPSNLELTPKEQVAKLREEFDDKKESIRKEWEKENKKTWPRYDHEVFNDKGTRIRKVGDCYDAHHIHPLQLGGTNEASNITPLDLKTHADIHSSSGSCNKLVEKVTGGAL